MAVSVADNGGSSRTSPAACEERRLSSLRAYQVLDTPAEASFDRIAQVAAALCECPTGLVTMVDKDRQWFKARFNFGVPETPRSVSFGAHAVERGEVLVVEDACEDARFSTNPLVLSTPNIRFYAGVPVRDREGNCLGTLCVIDQRPRTLTIEQSTALAALAHEVEIQLELRRALHESFVSSDDRHELAALTVHDLRGPLTSILLMARWLLGQAKLHKDLAPGVSEMHAAAETALRMTRDLLDVMRSEDGKLSPALVPTQVHALLENVATYAHRQANATGHAVVTAFEVGARQAMLDPDFIRRILSNLVDNALKYAPRGSTVTLRGAIAAQGVLRVSVEDEGDPIPPGERETIFEAGARLDDRRDRVFGLGLGLRFCRLAADALEGRIYVAPGRSERIGNAFVLDVPAPSPPEPATA